MEAPTIPAIMISQMEGVAGVSFGGGVWAGGGTIYPLKLLTYTSWIFGFQTVKYQVSVKGIV